MARSANPFSAKEVLDAHAETQGWNETTSLTLLCNFIDYLGLGPKLSSYLRELADFENSLDKKD